MQYLVLETSKAEVTVKFPPDVLKELNALEPAPLAQLSPPENSLFALAIICSYGATKVYKGLS